MMFLDCPAYLDQDGAARCGLPAEVRYRFTMHSTDGPLECAMIRCPVGHWFNGPIGSLTCQHSHKHHPGRARASPPPGATAPPAATTAPTAQAGPPRQGSPASRPGRHPARTALLPTTWGAPPACGSPP